MGPNKSRQCSLSLTNRGLSILEARDIAYRCFYTFIDLRLMILPSDPNRRHHRGENLCTRLNRKSRLDPALSFNSRTRNEVEDHKKDAESFRRTAEDKARI
jgi:hypothetical protein